MSPLRPTLHTFGVLEVTDVVPSPVVPTMAVKPKNSLAGDGMLVMVGVVGVGPPDGEGLGGAGGCEIVGLRQPPGR